ncbi:hypothetical protein K7432_002782 [Basidiobolus ranarum]|uniref:GATA-type domain-containing protein n=1 Tax=Basidiobolus ranarum TaxID=34480 RepID=A0ABR2W793_9FUNG
MQHLPYFGELEAEICPTSTQVDTSVYNLYPSEQTSSEPESPEFFQGTTLPHTTFTHSHGLMLEEETRRDYLSTFEPIQFSEPNYFLEKMPPYTSNAAPDLYMPRNHAGAHVREIKSLENTPVDLDVNYGVGSSDSALPSSSSEPSKDPYLFLATDSIPNNEVSVSFSGVNSDYNYYQPRLVPEISTDFSSELTLGHSGPIWNLSGAPKIPSYQANTCYFTLPHNQAHLDDDPPVKKKARTNTIRKSADNRECSNCHCTSSPSWRRCEAGQMLLCNACGL